MIFLIKQNLVLDAPYVFLCSFIFSGSTPRMWGIARKYTEEWRNSRFNPTHVGNSVE